MIWGIVTTVIAAIFRMIEFASADTAKAKWIILAVSIFYYLPLTFAAGFVGGLVHKGTKKWWLGLIAYVGASIVIAIVTILIFIAIGVSAMFLVSP